jgi:hypothetical protein
VSGLRHGLRGDGPCPPIVCETFRVRGVPPCRRHVVPDCQRIEGRRGDSPGEDRHRVAPGRAIAGQRATLRVEDFRSDDLQLQELGENLPCASLPACRVARSRSSFGSVSSFVSFVCFVVQSLRHPTLTFQHCVDSRRIEEGPVPELGRVPGRGDGRTVAAKASRPGGARNLSLERIVRGKGRGIIDFESGGISMAASRILSLRGYAAEDG